MHRLGCRPADHPHIGRRELLQAGGVGLLGMGLNDLLRLEAEAVPSGPRPRATAKSVVFIFQSGGPSQHETFDPKPEAPAEIRGEYGTTQTALAGVHFCEYLPKLAARADNAHYPADHFAAAAPAAGVGQPARACDASTGIVAVQSRRDAAVHAAERLVAEHG